MSSFILMELDSFANTRASAQNQGTSAPNVRRPTRGFQIREDTYATLQVWKMDGLPVLQKDSGARPTSGTAMGYSDTNTNFFVQSLSEQSAEKIQSLNTFGEDYTYFFGRKPRVIGVRAVLPNTPDFNWAQEWWANYEEVLRGTQLAHRGARAYLTIEDTVFEGYLLNSKTSKSSQMSRAVELQFSMLLTDRKDLSNAGSTKFPGQDKEAVEWSDIARSQVYGGESAIPSSYYVWKANQITAGNSGPSGLIDAISTGIGWFNTHVVGGANMALDAIKNVMMGKKVRFPPGYAGSELLTEATSRQNSMWKGQFYMRLRPAPADYVQTSSPARTTIWEGNQDEYVQGSNKPEAAGWRDVWAGTRGVRHRSRYEERLFDMTRLQQDAKAAFQEKGFDPDFYMGDDALFFASKGFAAGMYLGRYAAEQKGVGTTDRELRDEAYNATDYHEQTQQPYDPDMDKINYGEGGGVMQTQGAYNPSADQVEHGSI